MTDTKPEPKAGDPCPQCDGELVEHRAPTDAERKAAEDREQARPYPFRVDSASAAARAELGPLYECRDCGYKTRIKPDEGDEGAAAGKGSRSKARSAAGSSKE